MLLKSEQVFCLFGFGIAMVSAKIEDEMELMKERAVRFYPEEKQQPPKSSRLPTKFGGMKFGRIESWSTGSSKVFAEDHVVWEKGILDPGSELVLTWNRIFLFACLLALFVDPLFFYLPSVGGDSSNQTSCVKLDHNMSIIVTLIRTFADFFYVVNILVKFRTAYVAPSSRVFGRGELVMNRKKISRKYLKSDFSLDFAAALPLPQIVVWIIIPAIRSSNADNNNNALAMIVLFQYALRLYSIFPLSNKIIKATGVVTNTAWAGAAYNLILYMLASHVLGASWYLLSLNRQTTCWKSECSKETTLMQTTTGCHARFLSCDFLNDEDQKLWANHTSIFSKCNASDDSISFQYGIFSDALTKGTVSTGFIRKYFYCLWWGLQNLSSYGQNLMTSTYIGETSFAILIAIIGLVLFAHLIGNMQTYLQSLTVRLEQWRLKRRDTEEWMQHRQLPRELRNRVRKFLQYKWFATQGVNEESILKALPSDLRRDIQRHLCLDLVKRVPLFSQMDGQLLDAICERLVSSLSTEGTYIVCEGDPVTEMLFIIRGRLESSTTNGGRTGFFNSITLRPGDFCGEELLAWALVPRSSVNLPSSTRTVKALIEVEAFALRAEDLKFVANQFRRLHSKKLQQTFRFYSHHWRTWGAFFIQAAWRRSRKRKMAKYLNKYESMSSTISDENIGESCQEENCDACSSGSKALLACKFSASTRRGAQKVKDEEVPKLRKPDEPDFSAN